MRKPIYTSSRIGFRKLRSYTVAPIIYDLTVYFAERYVDKTHKDYLHLVRIAEDVRDGLVSLGCAPDTNNRETFVVKADIGYLLGEFQNYLNANEYMQWEFSHRKTKSVRALLYRKNRAIWMYKPYLRTPEEAANTMIVLLSQTLYLLGGDR